MDPFEELKRLEVAANIIIGSSKGDDEPSPDQVSLWQRKFNYSQAQAVLKIKEHRANISRPTVSGELWEILESRLEGHDREAYEHELWLRQENQFRGASPVASKSIPKRGALFLLKLGKAVLGEPLNTPIEIQSIGQMLTIPHVYTGVDEDDDEATFCQVDAAAQEHIKSYLAKIGSQLQPIFVPFSRARKDLSEHSAYPMLGLDSTLPQNRLQHRDQHITPRQTQYPVPYFFYGTLADPDILGRVLNLDHRPTFLRATIMGGVLKTWAGKYKALVDGPPAALVDGWLYTVNTEEQESALRLYETANYEVVRCVVACDDGIKRPGCTFRFIDAAALM